MTIGREVVGEGTGQADTSDQVDIVIAVAVGMEAARSFVLRAAMRLNQEVVNV
jgi:hypothetical protein